MDRIVYCVIDEGKVTHAFFDKDDATSQTRAGGTLDKQVHDPEKVAKSVLLKLDALQVLSLMNAELEDDVIVYMTVSNGGGMDGMDRSDKGGHIKFASFDRDEAEAADKKDHWAHLEARVVVPAEIARNVLAGLDPVKLLCVETHLASLDEAPAPRRAGR